VGQNRSGEAGPPARVTRVFRASKLMWL